MNTKEISYKLLYGKSNELLMKYRQFITYVTIGVLGLIWDFGGYWLLYEVGKVDYALANLISMTAAITHNFILNAIFTFKKKDKILVRYLSFYSIAMIGIVITEIALYIFHEKLGFNAILIKGVSLPIIAVIQFLLNKKITFNLADKIGTIKEKRGKEEKSPATTSYKNK